MKELTEYATAVLCSVALHGLLLAIIVLGWTPAHQTVSVKPRYIQATLLQIEPAQSPAPKVTRPPPETRRQVQEKQRAAAAAREKKQREARILKEQLAERARQAKQREDEQRRQRETQARKRKVEEARQRALERAFAEALEVEERQQSAEQDAQLVSSYSAYIRDRIASNWSRPPSARRGMEVELSIQLVPTGRVVSVAVVRSSGNDAFDRSAEQAVHKVEHFERLQELSQKQPRVFESSFRRFRLVFTPDDLRL